MHHSAQASHGYWELNSGPHACTLHQQSHLSSPFLDTPFFPSAKGVHINFHPFTSRERWGQKCTLSFHAKWLGIYLPFGGHLVYPYLGSIAVPVGRSSESIRSMQDFSKFPELSAPGQASIKASLTTSETVPSSCVSFTFPNYFYLQTACHLLTHYIFIDLLPPPLPSPSEHSLQGEKAPGCSLLSFCSLRWSPMCGVDGTDEWNKGEGMHGWRERKGSLYLERSASPLPRGEGVEVYVHPPVYPKTPETMLLCSVQAGDGSVLCITFVSSHSPTGLSYKVRPPQNWVLLFSCACNFCSQFRGVFQFLILRPDGDLSSSS